MIGFFIIIKCLIDVSGEIFGAQRFRLIIVLVTSFNNWNFSAPYNVSGNLILSE